MSVKVEQPGGVGGAKSGTEASRPTFGVPERLYFATDTGRLWLDTGSAWLLVSPVHEPRIPFSASGTSMTWTNMPSAITEFLGGVHTRTRVDFARVTQARFGVRVSTAGFAGAKLLPRFSTDDAVFSELAASAGGLDQLIDSAGTKRTAWADIAAGAKADNIIISVWGQGGDGIADPIFGNTWLEVR